MKTTLLLLIVFLITFSCTREKVPPIDQQCNATISFSNDVMPILEANCISCHQPGNTSGGYDLSSYSAIAATANIYGNNIVAKANVLGTNAVLTQNTTSGNEGQW